MARKFVFRFFPNGMEKLGWTFWPTQYKVSNKFVRGENHTYLFFFFCIEFFKVLLKKVAVGGLCHFSFRNRYTVCIKFGIYLRNYLLEYYSVWRCKQKKRLCSFFGGNQGAPAVYSTIDSKEGSNGTKSWNLRNLLICCVC